MSFNPDINKQTQEVIFSCKLQKSDHPSLMFSSTNVTQSEIRKHLQMFLDSKLDFKKHKKMCSIRLAKQWCYYANFKQF